MNDKYKETTISICYDLWAKKYQVPQEMQAPLKDTFPLKFQKSSVPRKYTTSKFSNPPPKIRGVHTLNFFDCQRIFLCLMVFCILKKPFHSTCHSDNSLKAGYFDVFHTVLLIQCCCYKDIHLFDFWITFTDLPC